MGSALTTYLAAYPTVKVLVKIIHLIQYQLGGNVFIVALPWGHVMHQYRVCCIEALALGCALTGCVSVAT